jgi:nucleoside-diphosphate-sugar epimerase
VKVVREKLAMKVILTGATGFAGSEVLRQLVAHAAVERVTCLVRQPLSFEHPKVVAVLQQDFSRYDDRATLVDHEACIWSLGGKASDLDDDPMASTRVTHDFPLALALSLAPASFRFCYLSGMGADPTERAWFPWERETRHLKGRTERHLWGLEKQRPGFRAYCFRPGGILPDSEQRTRRWLAPITVSVSELARAMIRVAIEGSAQPLLLNRDIQRLAAG